MQRMTLKSWFGLIIPFLLVVIWVGSQQISANSSGNLNVGSHNNRPELVEYIIVSNEDWSRFQTDVNARLAQGYSPVGGVAINPKGQPVQAMGR